MKFLAKHTVTALLFAFTVNFSAMAQSSGQTQQKEQDFEKQIKKQVDYFIETYKLDDVQAFRLDTLLQHYLPLYTESIQKMKASGAMQISSYQSLSDKWADFFDASYEKIFTPEQWKRYLKSAAGKEKQKRDIRMAEAAKGAAAQE